VTDGIREDLIVPLAGLDTTRLLEHWRWLVPESCRPLFASALGDLFLTDADGRIVWLDAGAGKLRVVANTADEFRRLAADPENQSYWFGAVLVDGLRAAGQMLLPFECYSYRTLPILGGEYTPDNFVIDPVVRHFRTWGPIHEKVRNLPDGATIEFVVTE
jgi:Domain of unknown function (DUF1851)